MQDIEARIEKIKAQNKKKKQQKKPSHKASRLKTFLFSALTIASTHFVKAQQTEKEYDPNIAQTEQTVPLPESRSLSQKGGADGDFYVTAKKDTLKGGNANAKTPNNDTGLRAAAAELAMDVDFMSNFLIEEGENVLSNFNMQGVTLTEDMADGIEAGEGSARLNKFALTTNYGNSDGRHCFRGTKNILNKYGISLSGEHAYEAVDQLRAIPEFTEIKCDYDMLGLLPGGTVVVQGKGTTNSGHIFVIGEQNGRKVQKCGRTYQLPTSNRRGSSGQRYGGLYVFVPSDCKLSLDLTADLYARGAFSVSPEELLLPVLKEDKNPAVQKMVKDMDTPVITKGGETDEENKDIGFVSPDDNDKARQAQGLPAYGSRLKDRSYS